MKRSTQDAEALLESLVRASRAKPTIEQAERLESKLEPWLEPKSRLGLVSTRSAAKAILVVIGLGLLTQVYEEDSGSLGKRDARAWNAAPRATFVHDEPATAPERATLATPAKVTAPITPNAPIARAEPVAEVTPPAPRGPVETPVPAPVREAEVDFLRRAQAALAVSPADALTMADEHPSVYPRGVLAQEREVIAIDALVRLGRRAEATARAATFRTSFPRSAHLSRVAALTGKP